MKTYSSGLLARMYLQWQGKLHLSNMPPIAHTLLVEMVELVKRA